MKKIRKGFTLIEMVIVLFIISLLLLIMIPNLAAQKDHADERSNAAFKTTLRTQAELYRENKNPNPTKVTVSDLLKDNYISEAQKKQANEKLKLDDTSDILDKLDKKDAES